MWHRLVLAERTQASHPRKWSGDARQWTAASCSISLEGKLGLVDSLVERRRKSAHGDSASHAEEYQEGSLGIAHPGVAPKTLSAGRFSQYTIERLNNSY